MVLDFFAEGRHLVVDAVATTVYRNVILKNASTIPGYAAKQDEDLKFHTDRTPSRRSMEDLTSLPPSRWRMEAHAHSEPMPLPFSMP